MPNPNIIVQPAIVGTIGGPASLGALSEAINWPSITPLFSFTPGTGSGQMDQWFEGKRTLATAAADNIDLNGSGFTDPFGVALAFLKVKLIAIYADPANTTDLTVGAGTNPFNGPLGGTLPTLTLKAGELNMFVRPAGYPVVPATGDILKILNAAGASATYSILIGGTSV